MSLERTTGWESRLFGYIEEKKFTPFAWGTHDCCTFAAGAVFALTEQSVFTPAYSNAFEANSFMESVGGIEAWMTEQFGEPAAPLQGRRGDIAMLALPDRELLSVVVGEEVVAPGEEHLLFYPIMTATKVWRIA